MANKLDYQPSELENTIVSIFQATWPPSANFREQLHPVIEALLKEMEELKQDAMDARMSVYNIIGDLHGADWSDEPSEEMRKQLRAWSEKYHEMKTILANDGFVAYSTGEKGHPYMVTDQYGRAKLLLINPTSGSSPIKTHGTQAPDNHPEFVKMVERIEDAPLSGKIRLTRQEDGDIEMGIYNQGIGWTSVKFRADRAESPKTRRALSALMAAIRDDEPDSRENGAVWR